MKLQSLILLAALLWCAGSHAAEGDLRLQYVGPPNSPDTEGIVPVDNGKVLGWVNGDIANVTPAGGLVDGDYGDVTVSNAGGTMTVDAEAVLFAERGALPTTLAGYGITDAQPLDSDLTSIAALSTTTFGRGLLDDADAAAGRTTLGLGSMAEQYAELVNITGGNAFLTNLEVGGLLQPPVTDGSPLTNNNTIGIHPTSGLQWRVGGTNYTALTSANIDTSAEFRALLTDETGTGALYFQGGDAGTPSALNLANATGLPINTGSTGNLFSTRIDWGSGTDGYVWTSNGAGGAAWEAASGGGIAGSTGATDNAILVADGTGGSTLGATGLTIDGSDNLTLDSSPVVGYSPSANQLHIGSTANAANGMLWVYDSQAGTSPAVTIQKVTVGAAMSLTASSSSPIISATGGNTFASYTNTNTGTSLSNSHSRGAFFDNRNDFDNYSSTGIYARGRNLRTTAGSNPDLAIGGDFAAASGITGGTYGAAVRATAESANVYGVEVKLASSQTAHAVTIKDSGGAVIFAITASGGILAPNLPTSEPATVGELWVDGTTVKVSDGP